MKMWLILLGAAVLVGVGDAAKLPPYMTPCKFDLGPKELGDCCQRVAQSAIPTMANGDKKYRIPNMKPLLVPKVGIHQGTQSVGLNIKWEPAEFWGLADAVISNTIVDSKNFTTQFDVNFPQFTISGHYTSSGRILVLPVTGSGASNVTIKNLQVFYKYDWPLKKGSDGKEYAAVQNGRIQITGADGMKARFEGLFNGDRLLSDNMHIFLNENWREVVKEIGPGVAEAAGEVVKLVVVNIARMVPVREMFIF